MTGYLQGAPKAELARRIQDCRAALEREGLDGLLVVQKTDFFYYSGTLQQGWLYIPVKGTPLLMVFKDVDRARAESGLDHIVSLTSPRKIPGALSEMGLRIPLRLGLELDVLPAAVYLQYQSIFTDSELVDASLMIRLQRAVKSDYEIQRVRAAAAMADRINERAAQLLKPGRTDIETAGELEAYARHLGHQGIVRMRMWEGELFYGHVMSGPSAALPSYLSSPTGGVGASPAVSQGPGFNTIEKNQPILVDFVSALDGYLADATRIFCVGTLPDTLMRAQDTMMEIQALVKETAGPGVITGELYQAVLDRVRSLGMDHGFMGATDRRVRFVGHGVGLELDEFPFIAKGQRLALSPGMVFALEPKMVLPGHGVVGIENTHLVTENGIETLTGFDDSLRLL